MRHVPKVPGSLLDKVSSSSFLCGAGGWGRGEQSGHSLPNRCLSVVGGDQLVPKSNRMTPLARGDSTLCRSSTGEGLPQTGG